MNLFDVLRKESNMKSWKKEEISPEEKIEVESKYEIPDGGDFNLYCRYNNLELSEIETEFKKIGFNIKCESEIQNDEIWIHIYDVNDKNNEIMSEKYEFNDESKDELINEFKSDFDGDIEVTEILKKIDSNYFFESHNYSESVMILVLAKFLSEKMDIVLFDCYNGCFLSKTKIKKILLNVSNHEN